MKKLGKLFSIIALTFLFVAPVSAAEENADTSNPWFINDASFDGYESVNPENYDVDEVYGTTAQDEIAARTGQGTAQQMEVHNKIRFVEGILMNPFVVAVVFMIVLAIGKGVFTVFQKRKENSLEERRIALDEAKFNSSFENAKEDEENEEKKPVKKQAKSSVTAGAYVATSEAGRLMSNASASLNAGTRVPGDVNGDGIVDNRDFNIPTFMQ